MYIQAQQQDHHQHFMMATWMPAHRKQITNGQPCSMLLVIWNEIISWPQPYSLAPSVFSRPINIVIEFLIVYTIVEFWTYIRIWVRWNSPTNRRSYNFVYNLPSLQNCVPILRRIILNTQFWSGDWVAELYSIWFVQKCCIKIISRWFLSQSVSFCHLNFVRIPFTIA